MTRGRDHDYDYIVVGAGSAGCVLAGRLSEHARVLLVEAGEAPPPESAIPTAWPLLLTGPSAWPDVTTTQDGTAEQEGSPVPWPHGRGIGGSSSINAMIHLRGHRAGYDLWPEQGAPGWGFDDLLPFFRRSEHTPERPGSGRGDAGPLHVAPATAPSPLAVAALQAAVQTGHKQAGDIGSGLEEGFGFPDLAIVDGHRRSVVDAYLEPARSRPQLEVVTGALVHRLLLEGDRCVGVEYAIGKEIRHARCEGEVILAAGAIDSPQVLLRSGIGPTAQLREVGIETVLDLPGVGKNLHDHVTAGITYATPSAVPSPNNHGELVGLVRSDPAVPVPDLQIFVLTMPYNVPGLPLPEHGFSIGAAVMAPYSRGSLRLSGAEPDARPILDPRYLNDPRDRQALLAGLRLARRIGRAPALAPWHGEEVLPGVDLADDDLDIHVQSGVMTYFHYAGTCRIGSDDHAVVDPDLRVRGIAGLRVADASVLPSIPTANTQATVLAIAERAAALIQDANEGRRRPESPLRSHQSSRARSVQG